jgi:hypothetical protein
MPRNAIWEFGEANWLPGDGNTYTGGGPAGGLGFGLGLVFAPAGATMTKQRTTARAIALAK